MTDNLELTIVKTIPASSKQVFQAWLDPKALARFMCPGPGMSVPKAEVDPRINGEFLIVMKAGDKELPHRGSYKTIDEYTTLSFTWISPFSEGASLVTLTFEQLDTKSTRLTLHHRGFPNEESRKNHEAGWTHILEVLAEAAPDLAA